MAGARASFPKLLASGHLKEQPLNFIVMPKYDIDVERLFQAKKRKFRLETMLSCGLIHNDIKPQNIMAHFKQNQVILIDFGLTMNTNRQLTNYSFKGTPYFASNN